MTLQALQITPPATAPAGKAQLMHQHRFIADGILAITTRGLEHSRRQQLDRQRLERIHALTAAFRP